MGVPFALPIVERQRRRTSNSNRQGQCSRPEVGRRYARAALPPKPDTEQPKTYCSAPACRRPARSSRRRNPSIDHGGEAAAFGQPLRILVVDQSFSCCSGEDSLVATSTTDFRRLTEPQGRLIVAPSTPRSVSQRCLLIHPEASRSEPNLPK
jgi:hypothetical protein